MPETSEFETIHDIGMKWIRDDLRTVWLILDICHPGVRVVSSEKAREKSGS